MSQAARFHDYCDRWCDRCHLAADCPMFQLERPGEPPPVAHRCQPFWERLDRVFSAAVESAALSLVLEGEAPPADEPAEILSHPLVERGWRYAASVKGWIEERSGESAPAEPGPEGIGFEEAAEVIEWYPLLIVAKLARAVRQVDGPPRVIQTDANGSARVALQGVKRSLAAWAVVGRLAPQESERARVQIESLARMRGEINEAFPLAWRFRRPGFDE